MFKMKMPIIDFPWSVHLVEIQTAVEQFLPRTFENWIFSDPHFKCLLMITFTLIKLKKTD